MSSFVSSACCGHLFCCAMLAAVMFRSSWTHCPSLSTQQTATLCGWMQLTSQVCELVSLLASRGRPLGCGCSTGKALGVLCRWRNGGVRDLRSVKSARRRRNVCQLIAATAEPPTHDDPLLCPLGDRTGCFASCCCVQAC